MTTLKKEIELNSVALMSGKESCAKICPSKQKGLRFHINNDVIEANVDNVIATDHCVVIGNKKNKIILIEHFMAACAICDIDCLDIYLTHNEMPILDGSSKVWVENFKKAGIEKTKNEIFEVKEPIYYLNGKTHLVVLPSDKLEISYAVNYKHNDLIKRWESYSEKNIDDIIEARTFGYFSELKMLQALGFARGASLENALGLDKDKYIGELRSENEPIKHKILDLIGDFYLTGNNPLKMKCHIIAKEAGHAVHIKVAKMLKDKWR